MEILLTLILLTLIAIAHLFKQKLKDRLKKIIHMTQAYKGFESFGVTYIYKILLKTYISVEYFNFINCLTLK